jgi:hypothetical protein
MSEIVTRTGTTSRRETLILRARESASEDNVFPLARAGTFFWPRNHLPGTRFPESRTRIHLQASHCAVLGGQLETVVSLSEVDPGFPTLLYTRNNKGETPGYAAAKAGHHEMLAALHAASPLILAERDNAGVCAMRGKGVERPTRDVIRALEGTVPRYLHAWHANISYIIAHMRIIHTYIHAYIHDTCPPKRKELHEHEMT